MAVVLAAAGLAGGVAWAKRRIENRLNDRDPLETNFMSTKLLSGDVAAAAEGAVDPVLKAEEDAVSEVCAVDPVLKAELDAVSEVCGAPMEGAVVADQSKITWANEPVIREYECNGRLAPLTAP